MKTTSFQIGTPTTSQLCSNAGLMLLATTADTVGVATAIDTELGDRQNPNLVHTTGHTMTALALALALGGDDAGPGPVGRHRPDRPGALRLHGASPPQRTRPPRRQR